MLAQRDRIRRRRHAGDRAREHAAAEAAALRYGSADLRRPLRRPAATAASAAGRAVVGEGHDRVDFGVLRKDLGPRHVDRAARAIDAEVAGAQARDHVDRVAQEEVGRVDQHAAVVLGRDGEAPQDRLREGVLDRAPLVGVGGVGAEGVVRLHHQDARADPLELDHPALARLPAIEPDVVRSQARGQPGRVEQLGVELVDLHPQRARPLVPVERHVAVEFLEPGGAGVDGLGRASLPAATSALGERWCGAGKRECDREEWCGAHAGDCIGDRGSGIGDRGSGIGDRGSGIGDRGSAR